jgi:mono/diheme cytochrome c family protein
MRTSVAFFALLVTAACPMPDAVDGGADLDGGPGGDGDGDVDAGSVDAGPSLEPTALPAYDQRPGDPDAGYLAMVNNPYVGCGVPESAYNIVFGDALEELRLPGREGRNATLPYDQTQFEDAQGVSVVAANCLFCHAARLPGPEGGITLGLGNANLDFTSSTAGTADLAGLLVNDPVERVAYEKWRGRVVATAPYLVTRTLGVNPADNLAGILFAHRDPATLAWSDTPLLDPPSTDPTPTDVPPWWLMRKKNVMFYTGSGRGDHARVQMTASTLCVDSVEEAEVIDSYFPDVRAWIAILEPPPFPGEVDADLAADGQALFEQRCAQCHGTYGAEDSYPNLLIPVEEVGTDPLLATGSSHFDDRFTDWFNSSFYGEIASLEPGAGYVAPPLDGIWATAPFLHNGSVPTLRALLDSSTRPLAFERATTPRDYDLDDVGWPWQEAPLHSELPAADRRLVYDTTHPGYGNGGHTYGDSLTSDERDAVIAYLKTL